jgi:hypothetical protein
VELAEGTMKKPWTTGKRGTKRARAKDLSAKRGATKGGASYTMFLADGSPVRSTQTPTTQTTMPGKIEYPN